MIKVFLAEDEFVVREGIKNNVDWAGHGYEFCGEAGDGELAYPMIQKLKPDIVITDIRMPFMDGLELSKLIKKEFPWIEIIILSGFEEFEYAKQGIKIGVAQYLTKPIKGDDLLKEVDIVAGRIEEKRRERRIREQYAKEMEEATLRERSSLFGDIVTGAKSPAQLMEAAGALSIDLSAMYYNIILLMLHSSAHLQGEYSDSVVKVEEKLQQMENDHGFLLFDRNPEGKALLFKADSEEELISHQNAFTEQFTALLTEYPHIRYFGGIGTVVNRLRQLPESFTDANRAFAHRYFVSDSRIVDAATLQPGVLSQEGGIDLTSVDPKQIERARTTNFLKLGSRDEAVYFVDEFLDGIGEKNLESAMFRQYIAMDCYFSVAAFIEELGYDRAEIRQPDLAGNALQSAQETRAYIREIVQTATDLREKRANSRYGEVVDEVIRYIDENYAQEDLSLNTLASHVNISPNHLSMIFSQQTGQTFIKYLTDLRMQKAKELLKCSNKRSSEIAAEVGYKDPHYFSYIFKKTQGMTPTRFREEGSGTGMPFESGAEDDA
ncbi:MAG: response regulator [Lachnospiraceae bacterium]|nr:response regulator [Lachnospiraceae bacterium]